LKEQIVMDISTAVLTGYKPDPVQMLRAYRKEIRYELLKLVRERGFLISLIGFPVVFFVLFGLANRNTMYQGETVARYLLANYSCFGTLGAAFIGIGVGLAYDRGRGWLELKRAGPMPTPAYLLAKLVASIVFGFLITAVLMGIGMATTNMHISPADALHLFGVIAGGALAFASMAVFAGLLLPPNSAAALANLIYLPLSLCGGLWMPIEVLPKWLQTFAHFLPSFYFSRLALHALGYVDEPEITAWLILAGYAGVFSVASVWVFRKHESQR
jgi:ABC-2 type transport system permease protein